MLKPADSYEALVAGFRWEIPARFNIATAACDIWAAQEPGRPAVIEVQPSGRARTFSYADLSDASKRLASALKARGVRPGDRIAIMLPQGRFVPIVHFAAYRMGAIAVPMAALFGVDALAYRLGDCGAKVLVTDAAGLAKIRRIGEPTGLEIVISLDGEDGDALGMEALLRGASPDFSTIDSGPDDPCLMIYTSGTTGQPKGALHGHRVLIGHLPGVQMPHEFLPQPGDLFWTSGDWAWAGGLLNMLLPALMLGVPVVARRFEKFDPDEAFALMERQGVRNAIIPPTALRMLRAVKSPRERYKLNLRTLASGGESLGEEGFAWGRDALGLTINEFYGQTECNLMLCSCAAIGVSRQGAIGKATPGHEVAILRDDGTLCETDEIGQIAVKRPNPVMFLGYWNRPEATAAKYIGDWLITGDLATRDADGYVRFIGRDDDIITSAGYRIGPVEIEDCLIQHPAVALAAAVGKPDALRTEIVKAFLVLRPGFSPSPPLVSEIQDFVRKKLSAHEYPREIEFIDALPMTTTGKVIRRELRERG